MTPAKTQWHSAAVVKKNDNDVIKSLTSPFLILCPHTLGISESQIKWIPVLTSKEKIFDIIMADNRILDSAESTKDYQVSNFKTFKKILPIWLPSQKHKNDKFFENTSSLGS